MVLAVVTLIGFEKVLTFVVMLSILIVLHEFGHFVLARRNGVRVNEFAVGFGPRLAAWTSPRSGTIYSVRAFPIGGFCAMEGEDGRSSEAEQQRNFRAEGEDAQSNFQAKSPWRRLAIILAGPAANFLLCYGLLLVGALAFGVPSDKPNQPVQPVVGEVNAGSPAEIAGIRAGDRIVSIGNVAVTSGKALVDTIHASLGKRLDLVYLRNGVRTEVFVTPKSCPAQVGRNNGCIGFSPVPEFQRVSFVEAVRQSGMEFANIADETVESLGLLVTQFAKYAPQMTGPIGMGQVAVTVEDWGWGPYFSLAATISFALGLFNLLPIPALDGGRAAFIIAELIRGRPVDPEKEAMVHLAGFAALMALIMLVAFHDIARIVTGQGVL
ncbi:MAG TPA: M50 family metallopeptidase [Candidatus Cybelea sp.]|jgi:regulator of sigma E protease|nr:M50 family metallopeptidase [Candidatus Cybelea sp.]